MTDDVKAREEQKRDRCWDRRARWRIIEQTIEWVDSQQPVPRNSRQGCLQNQARLLQSMASANDPSSDSAELPTIGSVQKGVCEGGCISGRGNAYST